MAFINHISNEITCKIVYDGPSMAGKTTNIQWLYYNLSVKKKKSHIQIPLDLERTQFFDFFPIELGTVQGVKIRFHLYTVPGQKKLQEHRQTVFKGVDGVVFVADSQPEKMPLNKWALEQLEILLKQQGQNLLEFPLVFQYNKRDLVNPTPLEQMRLTLNHHNAKDNDAIAKTGEGIMTSFKSITQLILDQLNRTK